MGKLLEVKKILEKGIGKDFPGASFGMIFPDGHIETDYVGYKSLLPEKILCDGTEIYDIASLTKVVSTTTMMMRLIDQNLLSLNDSVSQIIPRFKHPHITIADLLTHQSGLPADISNARTLTSREEVLNRIFDMDLIYPTKTKIVYSDVGFILCGLIIETMTKQSLDIVANDWIFKPLQMKDTSYRPDRKRAAPTEYREDTVTKKWLVGQVHDEKSFAMNGLAGHAGLFSTAYDLCLFMKDLLFDQTVLKKETIDALFCSRVSFTNSDGTLLQRAYGWDKNGAGGILGSLTRREDIIGHTGFTGCHMVIDRKYRFGFVLLSNAVHPKRELNHIFEYRKKIAQLLLKA